MMQNSLFETCLSDHAVNILSKDGSAHYYPNIFNEESSTLFMSQLQESLTWGPEQLMMFGKLVTTRRKVAWVGDPKCSYTYSGIKKIPQNWTSELLFIKAQLEEISQSEFNSCLLNLYHDGNDGMGWHSDDEKELDPLSPIASLSLGAQRKFAFRHKKDKETISLFLENGSALIMHPPTQEYWQHALLKSKTASDIRINLTFRKINIRDE
ncbi:alpha-ketoglutarate-dependent dioxygenase AlkB [Polynucleobacter paneuropaeus]|uniref:Alpha-ketoglutarate-dependent dioxygenase AlkB n=1 Tax=Polynucleobacter paneuropaeus TaxID=2527775 RepID=A0AAE2YKH9_9BURK|nr:alpha-ketoglutarate-dependent dioxygenase AlkB [Polynucleobacter paneuropaeus]MBT8591122.1 alpha-ketoglutarate-dependent dioxygenase AlkB [Polynucleobacter paneuropaeus]MBT8596513.1 alpha-ketoglutarate-dependent dioxygenase AlkB [Polynucleobacter paneuropaeus]MBT8598326.1 alpha-ketoglutarate-dependent dioxygenase AlkB [Polynucleobacter paneuropaeus]